MRAWVWRIGFTVMLGRYGVTVGVPYSKDSRPSRYARWTKKLRALSPVDFFTHARFPR